MYIMEIDIHIFIILKTNSVKKILYKIVPIYMNLHI